MIGSFPFNSEIGGIANSSLSLNVIEQRLIFPTVNRCIPFLRIIQLKITDKEYSVHLYNS